ncbi:MAG: type VI secretion system membrane subunit TssM, partial [Burkholderiales bacterium]|nr:type VI secretion system membrane subunit TssM [Burkholderiales bacterium]
MKRIFSTLLQPALLTLLGLLALALLVWWIGPLIAIAGHVPLESATARATAIVLLLLAFVLRTGYRRFKARAGEVDLLRRLFGRPKPVEPAEVQRLRRSLERAVQQLHQIQPRPVGRLSRLLGLGQQRPLYQRPWYLLLGAPGSGKTTALAHCGLQFTPSDPSGIEQIRLAQLVQDGDGTPGCDWWLSDEAVLLDTAGRYTSQDSGQASDREGWLGLLGLLRQQRPRQPLNGVILTLSAADLLAASDGAAARQAQALRARLQELERQLGLRLPVYLLVTKADLIAGFEPFFATLDQSGRDQVWGCTLPLDGPEASDPLQSLTPRLDALRERLQQQQLARLQEEPELDRRSAIAGFDQQFAACCHRLLPFVRAVFAVQGHEQSPLLRGVYFSSAIQQGQPVDPLLSRLGQACGLERGWLPASAGSGRSYFLPRLLRELVFAEQQLSGLALAGEKRRERLQLGLLAAIAAASVTLLAAWAVSYRNNSRYVAQVDQAVAATRPMLAQAARTADLVALLPLLETVANISATPTRAWGEPAAGMGLGLFQGDKLDAAARQASGALQRELLLPRISQRIDQQLREQDGSGSDPEFSYQALKAYLMLHEPAHFDPSALKAWLLRDGEHQPTGRLNLAGRAALERQLDALFAAGPLSPPTAPDPALIGRTRNRLLQEPLARR